MPASLTQIREELDRLTSANGGRLLVDDVVVAAQPEGSVLHDLFDWDQDNCTRRDLRRQARKIIERVRHIPGRHDRTIVRAPLYVRDPDVAGTEQGYTSVTEARKDPVQAGRTLDIEFDRAKSAMRRACNVAEVLGLADDISALLVQMQLIATRAQAIVNSDEHADSDQRGGRDLPLA